MSDDKNCRHRFTVPCDDTVVNTWIENQSNLGFSLRVLIKDFVRTYGNKDATCVELGTVAKRRGRPPKQIKNLLNQMDGTVSSDDYDDDDMYDEPDVAEEIQEVEVPVKPVVERTPKQTKKVEEPATADSEDQVMSMFKSHDFTGKTENKVPVSADGNIDFDELINN